MPTLRRQTQLENPQQHLPLNPAKIRRAVLAMFLQYVGRVLSLLAGALRGRLEACFAECSEAGEKFCAHLHPVFV